jgi:glycosyltransferase involved in cell wall biosynthesis
MKIVLVSPGQPSLNPRLVKEADTLVEAGYAVIVLYGYWNQWASKFDEQLFAKKKWTAVRIGGDPITSKWIYNQSRVIHKIAKNLSKIFPFFFDDWAIARNSYHLIKEVKKYRADLYIAHNLGALAAVIKSASKYSAKCAFDAEDFHRNEGGNDENHIDRLIKTRLEKKYFPYLNYFSASSPLVSSAYNDLFPELHPEIILNVFPSDKRVSKPRQNNDTSIKLFWFSQTIGHGRGLEEVIKALDTFDEGIFELHLLGQVNPSFKINGKARVHLHEPIPSEELIYFASQFDIGLAVETGVPLNRDICLTNKIFTYIQAGLCVVASDTRAQVQLFSQCPGIGKIYQKSNPQALAGTLSYFQQHRDELFNARSCSFDVAKHKLNWENESERFLRLVDQTLARR